MNYATGGASTGTTFMPAPLILDNKGRHIDQEGKEVKLKIEVSSTPNPKVQGFSRRCL